MFGPSLTLVEAIHMMDRVTYLRIIHTVYGGVGPVANIRQQKRVNLWVAIQFHLVRFDANNNIYKTYSKDNITLLDIWAYWKCAQGQKRLFSCPSFYSSLTTSILQLQRLGLNLLLCTKEMDIVTYKDVHELFITLILKSAVNIRLSIENTKQTVRTQIHENCH